MRINWNYLMINSYNKYNLKFYCDYFYYIDWNYLIKYTDVPIDDREYRPLESIYFYFNNNKYDYEHITIIEHNEFCEDDYYDKFKLLSILFHIYDDIMGYYNRHKKCNKYTSNKINGKEDEICSCVSDFNEIFSYDIIFNNEYCFRYFFKKMIKYKLNHEILLHIKNLTIIIMEYTHGEICLKVYMWMIIHFSEKK